MIWIAILIPILTTALLYAFWRHEVVIWEFIIPFVVSVILIGISGYIAETSQTDDTEFWGSLVVTSTYYEDWNEKVSCSHPRYCTRCSGAGKTRSCSSYQCGTMHAYDVDYHPEYWEVRTTSGEALRVPKAYHQTMVKKFGGERFVDLRRNYHTDDGDKYVATWPKTKESAHPVTTRHTYENRIQASRSVFNYRKVSPEEIQRYGLYRYSSIFAQPYRSRPLVGYEDKEVNYDLRLMNGYFGPQHQVRVWVLVFRNQPRKAGLMQENLWVGGNKNEFVVTVGIDSSDKVEWAHVFSWTKNERLKIDVREVLQEQETLNLKELVSYLGDNLPKRYERREFEEFSYLKVEIPLWVVGVVFLLVLLANVITAILVVKNNVREPSWNRKKRKW